MYRNRPQSMPDRASARPPVGGRKAILALIAEGFLGRLAFGFISLALPLYAHSLGYSMAEIGVLITVNLTVAMVLAPAMGKLADRIGLKNGFVVSLALHTLSAVVLIFPFAAWHLYGARVVAGFSRALRLPTGAALIAVYGGKKSIAQAFAWYATAKSVAGSLGKALAGILITVTAANYSLVFLIAAVASLLPIVAIAAFVPADPKRRARIEKPAEAPSSPPTAPGPSRQLLPAMTFGFMVNGTAQMLRGLLPVLAVEYAGLTAAETGMIFLVTTIVALVAGPAFGWIADHFSRRLVLSVRAVANMVSSAVFLAFPSLAGFFAGAAVDTVGKAAFKPAWGSLMASVSAEDKQRRGRSMGWLSASEEAGAVAGPILAGLLWTGWGAAALFGVRIGLSAAAEVYAFVWQRALRKAEPEPGVPVSEAGEEDRTVPDDAPERRGGQQAVA